MLTLVIICSSPISQCCPFCKGKEIAAGVHSASSTNFSFKSFSLDRLLDSCESEKFLLLSRHTPFSSVAIFSFNMFTLCVVGVGLRGGCLFVHVFLQDMVSLCSPVCSRIHLLIRLTLNSEIYLPPPHKCWN